MHNFLLFVDLGDLNSCFYSKCFHLLNHLTGSGRLIYGLLLNLHLSLCSRLDSGLMVLANIPHQCWCVLIRALLVNAKLDHSMKVMAARFLPNLWGDYSMDWLQHPLMVLSWSISHQMETFSFEGALYIYGVDIPLPSRLLPT